MKAELTIETIAGGKLKISRTPTMEGVWINSVDRLGNDIPQFISKEQAADIVKYLQQEFNI